MTGFLLDTNVLSEFARTGAPDRHVDRWLKTTAEEVLFASVLTFAEIRRGIEVLPAGKRRTQLEQWQDDLVASFEMRLLGVTKSIGRPLGGAFRADPGGLSVPTGVAENPHVFGVLEGAG